MEDYNIVEKIRSGNDTEFDVIYHKYHDKLFNYIYVKINNTFDVEDLLQETFAKVYRNIDYYNKDKSSFYNFILANANQVIAEYFRKELLHEEKTEKVVARMEIIGEDELTDICDSSDVNYRLSEIFSELSAEQLKAINLIYAKRLSYKEAARIMGKSELSLKSLLFRVRNKIKHKIVENYPEIAREYGFKKALKIVIVSGVCLGLIGGFSYATWRLLKDNFRKESFNVTNVVSDISDENAIVSRSDACVKINEYLKILGVDVSITESDLHLRNDYQLGEICWLVENDDFMIGINAITERFVEYAYLNNDISKTSDFSEKLLNDLNLINGYDLEFDENSSDVRIIEYAKKYGDIFNKYQSCKVMIEKGKILNISTVDYDYEDAEIKVSKEDALKILHDNGIDVNDVELVIENVNFMFEEIDSEKSNEDLTEKNANQNIMKNNSKTIKKVWKVVYNKNIVYIDVEDGNIYTIEAGYAKKGSS